ELKKMAECYQKKKPSDLRGEIHLLIGEDDGFLVRLKDSDIEVEETGVDNTGDLGLVMSEETFDKLNSGKWNGMTAVGRSSMSEPAPLDFRLPEDTEMDEILQMMYHFLTHFFSKDYPTITELGRKHSRKVHGGNAVPIAYGDGIRSAYYTIQKGEQINEDELDPWNQVFTVIGGSGKALVDGEEIELKKNMSVHVPPNKEHIVKKEEGEDDLELLWIAYGEKA
ncbi:MAG: cupin domain-containing protein, partial [Candidatus Thermoplasmatota archaeon]|nr:cupin domain-containing protein [Candidatus Thermoplasmatota archaeon]